MCEDDLYRVSEAETLEYFTYDYPAHSDKSGFNVNTESAQMFMQRLQEYVEAFR